MHDTRSDNHLADSFIERLQFGVYSNNRTYRSKEETDDDYRVTCDSKSVTYLPRSFSYLSPTTQPFSGKLQPPPLGFGNPVAKLLGRVNPETNGLLSARQCGLISVSVGHTTRKLRNLSDKSVVLGAPVDDHFVPITSVTSPSL